jgi:UDP:flavonoid glycosyltransferase YjiC (YdhE family)
MDDVILGTFLSAFIAEMAGRFLMTTWCPQEQVLHHLAMGCFLTHNVWNSTCESIAVGVPTVCWPGFTDHAVH